MLTPEEIFMTAFKNGMNAAETPDMPVLEKLAQNLDLGGEEQETEMPILEKLAQNLDFGEEDEEQEESVEMPVLEKLARNLEAPEEETPEIDLSSLTDLEKLAFMKWAEGQGVGDWIGAKAKGAYEGGKNLLKGKEWVGAEKAVEEAKSVKPGKYQVTTGKSTPKKDAAARIMTRRAETARKAGVASSEAGLSAAKQKRYAFGKKVGIGAGAAGGALLTAAVARKLISGRKKTQGDEAAA